MEVALRLRDELSGKLPRAGQAIQSFSQKASRSLGFLSKSIFSIRGGVAGLVGGVASGGLAAMTRGIANQADLFQKLGIRIGVTTEFLSEMAHVADLNGVAFSTLADGLTKSTIRMGDFVRFGTGPAKVALESLSEELQNAVKNGESIEEIFPRLAREIELLNPANRAIVTGRLFGRGNVKLAQLFEGGPGGVEAQRKEARDLGISISQDLADRSAEFNDSITRMGRSMDALKIEALEPLIPVFKEITDTITSKIQQLRGTSEVPDVREHEDLLERRRPLHRRREQIRESLRLGGSPDLRELDRISKTIAAIDRKMEKIQRRNLEKPPADIAKEVEDRFTSIQRGSKDPRIINSRFNEKFGVAGPREAPLPLLNRDFIGDLSQETDHLREAGKGVVAGIQEIGQVWSDTFSLAHDSTLALGDALAFGIVDNLHAIATGAKGAKSAFRDMGLSILSDIAQITLRFAVLRSLGFAFGAIGGTPGPTPGEQAVADRFSFVGGLNPNTPFGARGGVMTQPTIGGEAGPEAFVPLPDSRKIPVEIRSPGGGGGGNTYILNVHAIDTRSWDDRWMDTLMRQRTATATIVGSTTRDNRGVRESFA